MATTKSDRTDQDTIRETVSRAYTRAVKRETREDGGCCAPATAKGVAARLAGYEREELELLPGDAVSNSFGCGNPLAFSEVREGEVVLDLGSGAGIDLLLAARRVGPTGRVIGVDMTGEMIERARRNVAEAGLENVEVRRGVIEELPVEDASVDWVISNCVINLSPDKPSVFREIARVLRPGGRMRVSDIVVEELPEWVRRHEGLYSSCVAGAVSEDEYLRGLREAGLEDVRVQDRLVYDGAHLKGLARSEIAELGKSGAGEGPGLDEASLDRIAEELAGKIWSALIVARRPGP